MIDATDYIDLDEGREEEDTRPRCYNCRTLSGILEVYVDDELVFACDDCLEEHQRVEAEGDELAALPSCEERQRIIDTADSVRRLVNALKAHDQGGCAACAAVVCDDCGKPAANLTYDADFDLRICPACALKQARLDRIVAEHNTERQAA